MLTQRKLLELISEKLRQIVRCAFSSINPLTSISRLSSTSGRSKSKMMSRTILARQTTRKSLNSIISAARRPEVVPRQMLATASWVKSLNQSLRRALLLLPSLLNKHKLTWNSQQSTRALKMEIEPSMNMWTPTAIRSSLLCWRTRPQTYRNSRA